MRRVILPVITSLASGAALAAELPQGRTVIVERKGECSNAPTAIVHTQFGGQLRFYLSDGRIYQSFAADSFKVLAYVPDGREHVRQASEKGRRFPVSTRAAWDGTVLSASYHFKLSGAALSTERSAKYEIEIDAAGNRCRLKSDELFWRQLQKNGSVLRDSTCRATTSTCTIVPGQK